MGYSDPNFSFNPTKSFGFDPSNSKTNTGGSSTPLAVTDNLFIPPCSDTNNSAVENQHNQMINYANNFGMTVTYWPKKYQLNTQNFLYGEDVVSGFYNARKMKALINFTNYTTFMSKFGMMSDSDIEIQIPIRSFEATWGPSTGIIYPLAGDLFLIDDTACNRPLRQTPMVFEVTDKQDHINPVDFMARHYVWKLTAKRFDYSYEPNSPIEIKPDGHAGDSGNFGRQEGGANPADINIVNNDVNKFAKDEFELPTKDQSQYGNYL